MDFPAVGDNRPSRGFATHGEANTPSGARAELRGWETKTNTRRKNDDGSYQQPRLACARVRGLFLNCSQSGFTYKPISSQTTGARTRTREAHAAIRNPEAYFRAWREAKFGGDFDPIAVAVDEAVAAFSSGKSPAGRDWDRREWLKIANRVGVVSFRDAFSQMLGRIDELADARKRLRNPAASFQKLLNRRFPREGGAA